MLYYRKFIGKQQHFEISPMATCNVSGLTELQDDEAGHNFSSKVGTVSAVEKELKSVQVVDGGGQTGKTRDRWLAASEPRGSSGS